MGTNKTLDLNLIKSFANRTTFLNKELVTILNDLVNVNNDTHNDTMPKSKITEETESYDAFNKNEELTLVESIEESPDYASSIVLASDVLSLTSAVANVENAVCKEQGYKFLDGLLQKKRWALQSEY